MAKKQESQEDLKSGVMEAEEDDFEFGGEGKEEGGDEDESDEKKEDSEVKSKEGEEADEGESGKDSGSEDAGDDDGGAGAKELGGDDGESSGGEGDEEGKGEEGKTEEKADEAGESGDAEGKKAGDEGEKKEEDFFGTEADADKSEEGKEQTISYKPLADEFGIELEKNDDPKELVKKVRSQIEGAKKELKLDGYTPEAQSLIKHLNENKGSVEEFLTNPLIAEMQNVLSLEPEEKVRLVRTNELIKEGKTADEAAEAVATEFENMTVKQVREFSDNINSQATEVRNREIKKVVGDRQKTVDDNAQTERDNNEGEVQNLKNYVQGQEDFLGIKLTPEARAAIVHEIDTGGFDKAVEQSPAASKFFAYMVSKYGTKIINNFTKAKTTANRKGYNAALDKQTDALHKSAEEAAGKKTTGHSKGEEEDKSNFADWGDDLFVAEEE